MLVMELLMIDLTSHVKEHGVLPDEKAYSILHDVAEGLCYLHSLKPPVIHRDLSSNNVLLSYNMTAKISDFGVARMLNLSPLQVSSLTEMPGTRTFMPPEVDSANPSYDTSVDVFSFGVIMIHILSGKWPQPQWSQFRIEDDKKIPLSEAERRDVFLQTIRYKHPMMDLILKCIDDIPRYRGDANDILRSLETLQFVKKADSIEVEEETGQKELSAEDESVIDGHQQLSQDASEMISVGVTRTKEEDCGANQESLITISDNSTGGGPTSVLAQGLSHIKADLIDIKDTIKSAVTEIFDYATSVPLQKGSQTSPDVTVSSASADQEELQYRMKAEEQYDIIVVPSNVAKKHLEQDQSLMSSKFGF